MDGVEDTLAVLFIFAVFPFALLPLIASLLRDNMWHVEIASKTRRLICLNLRCSIRSRINRP